ncbi:hypothetical protein Ga0100231_013760 [Opitutaceae bacterium TAV4]|nr:hypothetical protein Ga0100231_013760 [Opitutaceae bacterium TAV4]RRJ99474.1 hypothetical protein Ga0100230_015110 [Opitutaceae bacterium TAV3]
MLFQRPASFRPVLLVLSAAALTTTVVAATAIELAAPGITLRADRWDRVTINTPQGDTLLTLTGFALKWSPPLNTNGGTLRQITDADGSPALEIAYQLPPPPSSTAAANTPAPAITARITPRPGRVDVVYDIQNIPATIPNPDLATEPTRPTLPVNIGGSMFGRVFPKDTTDLGVAKLGLWTRHEHGGLPSEHPDGRLMRYQVGSHTLAFAFAAANKANDQWRDGFNQHTALTKTAGEPGRYTTAFSILVAPVTEDWPVELLAARWHARPFGLKIGTSKTYNWWTAATPADPLTLDITFANTAPEHASRTAVLKHWIRDYAGNIVSQSTRSLTLAPGILQRERIPFAPKPAEFAAAATAPERDIFFAEVSLTDKTTGTEIFSRTNITLLPPHHYKSTSSADSIIGLSAYWPIPDKIELQRLLQRAGVRWLRQGRSDEFPNVTAILHDNIDWKKDYTPVEREAWIRKEIKRCLDQGNRIWEFSNEINFAGFNIGLADTIKGRERRERLTKYIDWLREIRRIQKELGPPATDIKLLSTGLAGMDVPFIEALNQLGGWDLLDGIALHPGRGNFAVDYPVYDPPAKIDTWDDWKNWKLGAHGSYWNFYGSVITAKALINRYDAQKPVADPTRKTLWLTEVYSPGWPNSWWEDTPRNGTENVILTLALAKAEGVKAAFWYQLFDTVWHNKLSVNPGDREYYFGLIQRDLSFKPTFVAFCTTAEHLEQATFRGWIDFPSATNAKTRGLLFDTPRGQMTILWDRGDGYVLTKRTEHFISPEPWVDTWKTHTPVTLPAAARTLTTINPIGQKQTHITTDGTARLQLTGAPLIVYGLDATKLKLRAPIDHKPQPQPQDVVPPK